MRLIEIYILRRIVVMFFAVLLSAVAITWIVQVLGRINFLTTSGQSFFYILKFSSNLLPNAFPIVMPFALVIAVTQTLSTMNQDSELVVINAAGAPRSAVIRPVMLFAIVIAIASFLIANFVVPYSQMNMRQMVADARADVINLVVQQGTFKELDKDLYLQIENRDSNGAIKGLFVSDSRDKTTDLIYYAKDGLVVETGAQSLLIMKDGEIDRRDVQTGNVSIIKFNTYALDLAAFLSSDDKEVSIFPKDRPLDYLWNPDPNDKQYQQRPLRYTSELYKRLSDWMYPIVFALISLAAAADSRSHREARISASFTAITLSLIVFWLGYSTGQSTDKNASLLPLLFAFPILAALSATYALATNRQIGVPVTWTNWARNTVASQQTAFAGAVAKLFGRKRGGFRK
ncbi:MULTISPECIES: LptF/LptG family permease [Phyllobacterium]|jgi:lipopolysaccharide export system permease protein|uniref:LPS export ABC transporter permease LptF n=1 Tax=Phyllobacterium sophorae TaxID=1520277 RepID=A0A2P7BAS8_9HYPH|nr:MULTISPECIES: LptF/LptG family permease [Phyllobacterium]PSH63532.1 LPS export ABC transporter permease LptF [Phyllobacterium sophorae]UXN63618.1 LptF/LptG family permease [Phyllobacterium sp. A18/5-2]